ncbi:MAG: hypothetical protein ACFFBD_26565 [Candidatus Hodarchaeota archaeon]
MIIIRFEVSGKPVLHQMGLGQLIENLKSIEMINAYQYDQKNFFSLQRIHFANDPPKGTDLEEYIMKIFNAHFINILGQSEREVICIMKQSWTMGYFPNLESGPWAFLFPILVTQDIILLNVITN